MHDSCEVLLFLPPSDCLLAEGKAVVCWISRKGHNCTILQKRYIVLDLPIGLKQVLEDAVALLTCKDKKMFKADKNILASLDERL